MKEKIVSKTYIRNLSILSFIILIGLGLGGFYLYRHLKNGEKENGAQKVLRTGFEINEKIALKTFDSNKKSRVFNKSEAVKNVRVNGYIGIEKAVDTLNYAIQIIKNNGDTLKVTLADLQKLPKTEVVFNFKCIEGWSQITYWGGVKFTDFIKEYGLEKENALNYVGLETPDKKYYVGIEHKSMIQPQTILAYEMNAKLLPASQGYPVRLIIPVK